MITNKYSKNFKTKKLNYFEPIEILKRFQDFEDIVFLDSASSSEKNNRYSYICVDPVHSFKIDHLNKNNLFNSCDEIKIRNILKKFKLKNKNHFPDFRCGLAGYISYDHCLGIENITEINNKPLQLDNIFLGVFDIVIAFDLKLKKTYLYSYNLDNYFKEKKIYDHNARRSKVINLYNIPRLFNENLDNPDFEWIAELTKKEYLNKIKKILSYIKAGDIFQVNFTQRFKSKIPKNFSLIQYYKKYRERTKTPFSALIKNGNQSILSFSPERFLKVSQKKIITSPIKGTARTDNNKEIDLKLKNELINSEKDQAENLMIVDVLRNDLSRVCEYGTVKVNKLAKLETYKNVHHLVSEIEGKLTKSKDVINVLNSTLPGGSITGAPKIRAMEIISELEKNNRGIYCGTIGYISFSGQSDFNIPIRTITINETEAYLNSGGGIVSDSIPEKEYKELMNKISNLFPEKKKKQSIDVNADLNK